MKVEAVDLFYLSMPEIADRGDGSQDALLVRVRAGGLDGWGECEAAPLPSIAAWCAPMSHSACRPLSDSVLGARVECPEDIVTIGARVRRRSFDLLQAPHTLSGIDIALWDLLGKRRGEPVWRLLGYPRAFPKRPYASVLFGDTAGETLEKARALRAAGHGAAKFGWGPYGAGAVEEDAAQVEAARAGLGDGAILLVDAGTVWGEDVERAAARLESLETAGALWLEEPFVASALGAYARLDARCRSLRLAGGEGSHDEHMARNLIDHGGIGYVQIDTGRVGGISEARRVADYAVRRGVTYVNHTFTTQLALAASLQPYAGLEAHEICEAPAEASPLACELAPPLPRDGEGRILLSEAPGLGVEPDPRAIRKYLVPAEIRVGDRTLYRTPEL